jgi:hypothetical protein
MLTYEYLPENDSDQLTQIDVAQRMQFSDERKDNVGALFHDNAVPLPNLISAGLTTAVFGNPMSAAFATAVDKGSPATVDNYHQTFNPAVSEPGYDHAPNRFNLVGPGCPECVHIHWRWDIAVASWFGLFGGGKPLIPGNGTTLLSGNARVEDPPSGQTVIVAVVDPSEPAYPGDTSTFTSLVTPAPNGAAPVRNPVFWYGGESDKRVDTFFGHGGFFAPPENTTLSSNQAAVTRSGFHYDSATKTFDQTVTIQNVSQARLPGPFALVLDNLSATATLAYSTGVTQYAAPLGSPYQFATFPEGQIGALAPGQTVNVYLQFSNPTNRPITYTPRVVAGGIP